MAPIFAVEFEQYSDHITVVSIKREWEDSFRIEVYYAVNNYCILLNSTNEANTLI